MPKTALQQIEDTFSDLDLWNVRTTAGFRPEPGSPLALDDEDWKPWRLSQLAFGGLEQPSCFDVDHHRAGRCRRIRPFDGHQGKAVRRSLSGAAHGLAWPMLGRVGTQQTSAADWELLDLRGAAPA